MKMRKVISVILASLLLVSSVFAMSSCKAKEEEKPSTLEEYVDQSDDAEKELDGISESMTNEILDGEVDVKGNAIVMTLKLKETYDSKDLDTLSEQFATQMDNYRDTFDETIEDMEEESGIQGIEIQVIVQNGDGVEIYSDTFTRS